MKKINLLRKAVKFVSSGPSYILGLEIISSEGISKDLFVKKRQRTTDHKFEDVFVAIASNNQIEDLDIGSPAANSVYFRTASIELTSSHPAFLDEIFNNVISELQSVVDNAEVLEQIIPDGVYAITADAINLNMGTVHTHYRIPLTAQPCGGNEIFTEDGNQKHRVSNQDADLSGWLNTVNGVDPAGTYFKYNINKDSTLGSKWPIPADFISYAHIEINGATSNDVLVNANGIFWKNNSLGKAPWPQDYVNAGNTGANTVVLVLDFVV